MDLFAFGGMTKMLRIETQEKGLGSAVTLLFCAVIVLSNMLKQYSEHVQLLF